MCWGLGGAGTGGGLGGCGERGCRQGAARAWWLLAPASAQPLGRVRSFTAAAPQSRALGARRWASSASPAPWALPSAPPARPAASSPAGTAPCAPSRPPTARPWSWPRLPTSSRSAPAPPPPKARRRSAAPCALQRCRGPCISLEGVAAAAVAILSSHLAAPHVPYAAFVFLLRREATTWWLSGRSDATACTGHAGMQAPLTQGSLLLLKTIMQHVWRLRADQCAQNLVAAAAATWRASMHCVQPQYAICVAALGCASSFFTHLAICTAAGTTNPMVTYITECVSMVMAMIPAARAQGGGLHVCARWKKSQQTAQHRTSMVKEVCGVIHTVGCWPHAPKMSMPSSCTPVYPAVRGQAKFHCPGSLLVLQARRRKGEAFSSHFPWQMLAMVTTYLT